VFTSDKNMSFTSFSNCMGFYRMKSLMDPKYQIQKVFDLSYIPKNFEELKNEGLSEMY
jgi:hypothetical protein